ncbi:MAG: sugar-binding protein, partial [Pseudomonadota bacterium]
MRSFIERTVAVLLGLAASAEATHLAGRTTYEAPRAGEAIRVDGVADESAWSKAPWRDIDQQWLGPDYEPEDFTGRYKVLWSPAGLHLLVEVVDDVLYDAHRDPLVRYWDDDCLEIFIDPDFSGGDHQYNHNAWA